MARHTHPPSVRRALALAALLMLAVPGVAVTGPRARPPRAPRWPPSATRHGATAPGADPAGPGHDGRRPELDGDRPKRRAADHRGGRPRPGRRTRARGTGSRSGAA